MPNDVSTMAVGLVDSLLLLIFAIIDLRQRRVPNRLLGLSLLVALGFSLTLHQPPVLSALLGGACGFAGFLLLARWRPGALGMGDVKLAGLVGVMVGFPDVVWALLAAIVAAGIAALALVLSRRARLDQTMAYAPYLAWGACLALFFL